MRTLLRRFTLWWRCSLHLKVKLHAGGLRMSNAEVGWAGEKLAAKWLKRHGRKVLYRNFSGPKGGEVDIVCRHRDVLTFIEVKTRTSEAFGRPADAVNLDKQRLIQRGASEWLKMLNRPVINFRFDIAEVILTEGQRPVVRVIENAFQLPAGNLMGRVRSD